MLSLNAEWMGLVLSLLNVPDFDDSLWEPLLDGWEEWMGCELGGEGGRRRGGGRTVVEM